jgi:hypothetical protein
MIQAELRTKIRELIASGVRPADPPPITRPAPASTPGNTKSSILIDGPLHEPTICGEPGPQVQYFYIAGQVVSVHAVCNALWKQELAHRGDRAV